jgi:hypothetical protein
MNTPHQLLHSHEHSTDDHLPADQERSAWEKSCHALIDVLEHKNLITQEEKIGQWRDQSTDKIIDRHAYYEHWILATLQILLERGFLCHEEVSQKSYGIALRALQEIPCETKTL